MKYSIFFMLLMFIITCGSAKPGTLTAAIEGEHRSAKNKNRDTCRHPAETLAFFGLKKNMNVIEISPGSGWYSEIISPYLREQGTYTVAWFDPNSPKKWKKEVNEGLQTIEDDLKYFIVWTKNDD